MEIRIACIGKLKSKAILELESAYLTRLRKRCQLSIQEIDDRPHAKLSASERRIKDSHRVLESIGKHEALVVLDEGGRKYSSYDFASFLNGFITTSSIKPVFAIGGPYGWSKDVFSVAHTRLSLSAMTLPHDFARLILIEQIYRAFTIIFNEPYQK